MSSLQRLLLTATVTLAGAWVAPAWSTDEYQQMVQTVPAEASKPVEAPKTGAGAATPNAAAQAEPRADETNAERAKSQPGNNAPHWRAVRESGRQEGYSSLPAPESGVLIQAFTQYPGSRYTTAGEAWREVRNGWITQYGGALIFIIALAIALFYWRKGPLKTRAPDTGRQIERFTYFERAAHWSVAISFSILAVSGLVMLFGKHLLLPILGGTLFGWLSYLLKNLHNFAGPVFALAVVITFIAFLRDNLPSRNDITWLLKGGGLISGEHVPSHRFNAGEKIWFWGGVFLLGFIAAGSGMVLDKIVPGLDTTRGLMQVTHIIHAVSTVLMMAMGLGHIYMGTIGTEGAYESMKSGYVDEAWAQEHHELWYQDIQAGKIPAQRSMSPPASPTSPPPSPPTSAGGQAAAQS